MANKQPLKEKQVTVTQPKAAPAAQKQVATVPFIFDKTNYIIMITGVVIIMVGFLLMSGGGY